MPSAFAVVRYMAPKSYGGVSHDEPLFDNTRCFHTSQTGPCLAPSDFRSFDQSPNLGDCVATLTSRS